MKSNNSSAAVQKRIYPFGMNGWDCICTGRTIEDRMAHWLNIIYFGLDTKVLEIQEKNGKNYFVRYKVGHDTCLNWFGEDEI